MFLGIYFADNLVLISKYLDQAQSIRLRQEIASETVNFYK